MRLFIISLTILAIITAGIVYNTIYMDKLTNEMLEIVSNLPEHSNRDGDISESGIDTLYDLWESHKSIVAINAGSIYINDITAALIDVRNLYLSDHDAHYQAALEHLHQAVYRLHELERFSLDNII